MRSYWYSSLVVPTCAARTVLERAESIRLIASTESISGSHVLTKLLESQYCISDFITD